MSLSNKKIEQLDTVYKAMNKLYEANHMYEGDAGIENPDQIEDFMIQVLHEMDIERANELVLWVREKLGCEVKHLFHHVYSLELTTSTLYNAQAHLNTYTVDKSGNRITFDAIENAIMIHNA